MIMRSSPGQQCLLEHSMFPTIPQVLHVMLSCVMYYMVCCVQYRKSLTLCFLVVLSTWYGVYSIASPSRCAFLCNVLHGMLCTVSQIPHVVLSCVMSYLVCCVQYRKSFTLCFLVVLSTWYGVYSIASPTRCAFLCNVLLGMLCTVSQVLHVVLSCGIVYMICCVQYRKSYTLCFLV